MYREGLIAEESQACRFTDSDVPDIPGEQHADPAITFARPLCRACDVFLFGIGTFVDASDGEVFYH